MTRRDEPVMWGDPVRRSALAEWLRMAAMWAAFVVSLIVAAHIGTWRG